MKSLHKLFDMPGWKVFLICFPIFTVFSFIIVFLFDMHDLNVVKLIVTSLIFGLIFTMIPVSTIGLAKSADKFYRFADSIEKMIREGEDKGLVLKEIQKLQEESFHRETGKRVVEIAKMYEVKYNEKILK